MDLLAAIHQRRAVRSYRDQPISRQQLLALVEAASWAPSAMNDQDWRFTVITDRKILRRISLEAKAWMLKSGEMNEHLRGLLLDPQFDLLHHAPALMVIAAPANHRFGIENCALAAENLMLAATDMGMGSCWIGLVQDWLNFDEGRKLLALPADDRVMAPIVIGYPQGEVGLVARKKPIITWIGDDGPMIEDTRHTGPIDGSGMYGSLIHP